MILQGAEQLSGDVEVKPFRGRLAPAGHGMRDPEPLLLLLLHEGFSRDARGRPPAAIKIEKSGKRSWRRRVCDLVRCLRRSNTCQHEYCHDNRQGPPHGLLAVLEA